MRRFNTLLDLKVISSLGRDFTEFILTEGQQTSSAPGMLAELEPERMLEVDREDQS